jgi:hypothetical protein
MVRIELTEMEAERLRELCAAGLSDLRMEIVRTDSVAFRDSLKQDEVFLKGLIERLSRVARPA